MRNSSNGFDSFRLLRVLEWAFALLGAVVCVWVVIRFASQQLDDLWLFPGLYFLEIVFLGLLAFLSRIEGTGLGKKGTSVILWMAGGALLAFVILAGFSIGLYLVPAVLAFWISAICADLRHRRAMLTHVILLVVAAFLQGTLIIGIQRLFM